MLISAYKIKDNFAVWNALKLHIDIINMSSKVKILVDEYFYNIHLSQLDKDKYEYIIIKNRKELFWYMKINTNNIFTITFLDTLEVKIFNMFFSKKEKIFYWVQGIVPEEAYLRNNSKSKLFLLSFLEKFALKFADAHVFVSESMVQFYKNKYNFIANNFIIIPCTSDLTYDGSIKIKDSFCYIGGLSKWQKIEETLTTFTNILKDRPSAIFHLITRDKEKAISLVSSNFKEYKESIMIYSLNNREDIEKTLSKMEFGFLLRENIAVNNVSSPIKLAEYLSCDVNVIISKSISSYATLISKSEAGVEVSDDYKINDNFIYSQRNSLNLFNNHFAKEIFINKYIKFLNIFKEK